MSCRQFDGPGKIRSDHRTRSPTLTTNQSIMRRRLTGYQKYLLQSR